MLQLNEALCKFGYCENNTCLQGITCYNLQAIGKHDDSILRLSSMKCIRIVIVYRVFGPGLCQ